MKRFWLFSCLLGTVAMPLLAQDFKITKMPGQVAALSSSGKVTGGPGPAYVWSRTGGVQYLGDLGRAESTFPQAINKTGEVIGQSTLADAVTSHAFLWTSSGGIQDLGSPQGGNSEGTAINDAGEVAGWSASPDGTVIHAFFWSAATGAVDLGTPPNGHTQSYGIAINDLGEVLGADGIPSYATPAACFRWTQSSGMQQSALSRCDGINHKGQIIGSDSQGHAAIWEPDGSIQDLGTLSGDLASSALSINRAGHVVGYSRPTPNAGLQRSFFWTPTGGIIDIGRLPKYPNVRSIPAGINNRDQVAGENGAAYLWSKTIGIVQVAGANYPAYGSLNDAGQFLGTQPNPVLATPIMHVTLTSSQNPSTLGQNVTLTAKIKAIVGLIATLTTSALKAGTNSITASYPGDDNYYPNKSAVLSQVVNP
jgi:probable HAF family extracellular repeat protein